jgi:hypothetical protein
MRIFAGQHTDAYLAREALVRGYAVVIWRGRHVVEPHHLTDDEAACYQTDVQPHLAAAYLSGFLHASNRSWTICAPIGADFVQDLLSRAKIAMICPLLSRRSQKRQAYGENENPCDRLQVWSTPK